MKSVKKVVVLEGGFSNEREVSLDTAEAAANALKELGFHICRIDVSRNQLALLKELDKAKPDIIFNALHGKYGEDGCIQGLLDMIQIPYTGSGRSASMLSMNKPLAKKMFEEAKIPVANSSVCTYDDLVLADPIARPFVIKPIDEGSSVGVRIIKTKQQNSTEHYNTMSKEKPVMVEKYIPGRELTVSVMGNAPLAITEITTRSNFYDYSAKYKTGGSTHIIPADIPTDIYEAVLAAAVSAHKALGCRGISRADFRLNKSKFFLLEINTQPGLTKTSLVPEQANYRGISFNDLIKWMVDKAECDE
ncbi:MAG: D-alanine--D-alanine ligase [Rhodospirillaceae bacterium]|nr:D-alanine--D-alanine ligase [Rhodospirillaceae bacterium]